MAAMEPDERNQPPVDHGATGASQGLLDRKEVLGGEFLSGGWWGAYCCLRVGPVFGPGVGLSTATSGAVGYEGTLLNRAEPASLPAPLQQGSSLEASWGSSLPYAWWVSCCTG